MRPDAPILAFDTSAAHCAAALLRGPEPKAVQVEAMGRGQAERLMPMLEEILGSCGLAWRDIALIGVGTGPGNFTGVRLSVAAARGLALALGVPAIGVSALEAWGFGLPRPLLVALDARRGQVFLQLFGDGGDDVLALAAPEALPAWAFEAKFIAGDAAERLIPLLSAPKFLSQTTPLAVAIGRIAFSRAAQPQPRPAPLYLRAADAAPPRETAPELLP